MQREKTENKNSDKVIRSKVIKFMKKLLFNVECSLSWHLATVKKKNSKIHENNWKIQKKKALLKICILCLSAQNFRYHLIIEPLPRLRLVTLWDNIPLEKYRLQPSIFRQKFLFGINFHFSSKLYLSKNRKWFFFWFYKTLLYSYVSDLLHITT